MTDKTERPDKYSTGTEDGLITGQEKAAAQRCMEKALAKGASQVRISLNKSVLDSYSVLNGELDKVMHSADRAISLYLFYEGRYGTFSTNMLDDTNLDGFVSRAMETARMLAPDKFRRLPDVSRTAKDAITGKEAGLYDGQYAMLSAEDRLKTALSGPIYGDSRKTEETFPDSGMDMPATDKKFSMVSEEFEYSDSLDDNYTIDSQGFCGRHIETSFSCCSEITVADMDGNRFSGYWWDYSPFSGHIGISGCSEEALRRAAAQIGPVRIKGGKYTMVVDRCVSSRLVAPLFSALNTLSIQQKNSFLDGSIGRKVLSDRLTIMDMARTPGKPGSRLYDSEGVATSDSPVILGGKVMEYFTTTWMSGNTGMPATTEGISRPVLSPCMPERESCRNKDAFCDSHEKEISLHAILNLCGDGIYVCGFNGGNCNPVTGDFSYGAEGFFFRGGKIVSPVREMLVTGNMVTLWNNLLAAGSDARECSRWQIPTLAFKDVDFSA